MFVCVGWVIKNKNTWITSIHLPASKCVYVSDCSSPYLCTWTSGPQMSVPAWNLGAHRPACCRCLHNSFSAGSFKGSLGLKLLPMLPWQRGLLCFYGSKRRGEAMATGVRGRLTLDIKGGQSKQWKRGRVRILIWSGGEKRREFVKEDRETSEWLSVKANEEGKAIEFSKERGEEKRGQGSKRGEKGEKWWQKRVREVIQQKESESWKKRKVLRLKEKPKDTLSLCLRAVFCSSCPLIQVS